MSIAKFWVKRAENVSKDIMKNYEQDTEREYCRTKLALDPYVKAEVRCSRKYMEDVVNSDIMLAGDARAKGLKVPAEVEDDVMVPVTWIDKKEMTETWIETRLMKRRPNAKTKSRKCRVELAAACMNPLSFLWDQDQVDDVEHAIEYYSTHDIKRDTLEPMYLVFLGKEQDEECNTGYKSKFYVREVCHIDRFGRRSMLVTNSRGTLAELEIDPDVWKEICVRSFVLFCPSDVLVISQNTNNIVV